jgi:transposase
MKEFPDLAAEQARRVQRAILKALAGGISWAAAASSLGISTRQMRRWRRRYELNGLDGLYDRRRQKPGPRVVPVEILDLVVKLYREKYRHLSVRQFHSQIAETHGIHRSYTWVKNALQEAGLVPRRIKRVSKAKPRGVDRQHRQPSGE